MPLSSVFGDRSGSASDQILSVLRAVRRHLGMDVGFVSEFVAGNRVFRFSDSEALHGPVAVGGHAPLEQSFCYYVAKGLMPGLMQDAAEDPVASQLPVTRDLPVGAHLSVPLRHADGEPYGTLCCFSFTPDRSLTTRDLATCVSARISWIRSWGRTATRHASGMRSAGTSPRPSRPTPSRWCSSRSTAPPTTASPPSRPWRASLPRRAKSPRARALRAGPPQCVVRGRGRGGNGRGARIPRPAQGPARLRIPARRVRLSVNLSPASLASPRLAGTIEGAPLDRLVIELTEHAAVASYEALREALAPFRRRGLGLAIDDVGAGHATLRHVLDLAPEFIKLDMSLIRAIDTHSARRALTEALTGYGRRIGCEIVAEGVETQDEYAVLRGIGVTRVQGFLTGRPMPLAAAAALPLAGTGAWVRRAG